MIEIIIYTLLGIMAVCTSCLILFLIISIVVEMITNRRD